jgi:hypothetical protein
MEQILQTYPFRTVPSLRPIVDHLNRCVEEGGKKGACLKRDMADLNEMLAQSPEMMGPIEDPALLDRNQDLIQILMGRVFSPVFWDSEAVAAMVPFSIRPVFVSPLFERLFLDQSGSFRGRRNLDEDSFNRGRVLRAFLFILDRFYGIRHELDYPVIHIVPDPETGLDRHYQMKLDFRFVEPHAVTPLKPLTEEERARILDHLTEPEVLRIIIPPEDFELHGLTLFQAIDITKTEVLSAMEKDLVDQESIISQQGFVRLQQRLRTFFRRSNLTASLAVVQGEQVFLLNSRCDFTSNCIFAGSQHLSISAFDGTPFQQVMREGRIVRIDDVLAEFSWNPTEGVDILQHGIRSVLIVPLRYGGEPMGALLLGSPNPGDLGPVEALIAQQIEPVFSMGVQRALEEFKHRVQGIIKEKCTAVHPTVEWRFQKAAVKHLEQMRIGQASEMEQIVFSEVYPIFGTADIRGSAIQRNRAIQKDLERHLQLALRIVELASDVLPMLILKELAGRIKGFLDQIQRGIGTSDEFSIVGFLQKEVESIFPQLKALGPKVSQALEDYGAAVDPVLGTVYRQRKDFEESVSLLNDTLSTYLDEEEAEVQTVFPHYFERHRTDGLDYAIYMGDSLVQQDGFSKVYLRNLRLWQLKVACGMAWQAEQLKPSLKVPLEIAQLILVQDTPLSIRFRFDERRFDVDGAYDIRHEIIKSRIDKATVKGTQERLTQPGRIAIVYSQPEEAEEMVHHVEFLQAEGFLTHDLERLTLEDLPSVQGLKSLRVGMNLSSPLLSERVRQMTG